MKHEKAGHHRSNPCQGLLAGYVLTKPDEACLKTRYDGEWQLVHEVNLQANDRPLLMNDFRPGIGCCTITALTAIFRQIQQKEASSMIPFITHSLFDQIESVASHHGYRPKRGRTNPLRIGSIARHLFRLYHLQGQAGSTLFLSARKICHELDHARPVLMNLAFGHYRRHTVTIVGYQIWRDTIKQPSNRQRVFWLVHDGWSQDVRFIDHWALTRPWSGLWSIYSVTRIRPKQSNHTQPRPNLT
ncbi:MAG: hypothetical protein PHQ83_06725 [Eubacteriales bacterium]|nr:hypothetical protein [Eubacteriales bacterium]